MNPRRILASILAAAFLLAGWGLPPAAPAASVSLASTDDDWYPLPAPTAPGGTVLDLAAAPAQPDLLYALIQDGARLFRSADAAESWEQVYAFDKLMLNLAVDPGSPEILYASGPFYLYRSVNNGQAWEFLSQLGDVIAAPAAGRVVAGGVIPAEIPSVDCPASAAVVNSSDYGVTWEIAILGCATHLTLLITEPGNPDVIYAGGYSDKNPFPLLWRSMDGGESWTQILPAEGLGERIGSIFSLAIDPENPERLFENDGYGSLASQDRGDTWEQRSFPPASGHYQLAAQGGRLYAAPDWGSNLSVYYSNNWGETWWQSVARLPSGITSLLPDPHTPGRLYAGLWDYGVWRSVRSGSDWRDANAGMRSPVVISSLAIDPSDYSHWLAGASEGRPGLFETIDSGLTWTQVMTDTRIQTVAIHPTIPNAVYAGGLDGVFLREMDEEWILQFRPLEFEAADINFSYHADPWVWVSGSEFITSNGGGGIMTRRRSSESGWFWVFTNLPTAGQLAAIAGDPHNPDRMFVAQGHPSTIYGSQQPGRIWRSLDSGHTWQVVTSNLLLSTTDLLIDPFHSGWIYAAGFNGLLVSQDGGDTWHLSQNHLDPGSWPMTVLAIDELGVLFAASGKNGVYRWDSLTDTWYQEGLYAEGVAALQYIPGPNRALIAGGTKKLWRRDLPPVHRVYFPIVRD